MSGRRGAGRRGGGGGGDYPGERQPEAAPAHGQRRGGRGGRGHGDGGRGRDGSRGGGGRRGSVPSPRREDPSPPPRPLADLPPSSSSSSPVEAASTSLSQDVQQRLTITEVVEGEASTAVAAPAAPPPPPASSKAIVDARRPGFGTVGRRCVVRANHFLVEVAGKDLVHYDVTITPEPVSKATNRKIISELVKLHKDGMLGRRIPAYDGMKSLYTAGALPFEVKDFIVKLPGRDQRREKEFKVSIKHAGCPDLNYLREFLSGRQTDAPQEVIQALDVVLRQSPSSKYTTVARSFYSSLFGHRTDIGDGLECWRGYYQSLRPTQMGLCLNIDISAASFYKPVNVVEFVAECLNLRDLSRPLSDLDRSKIKKALRGVRVEATHRRDLCIRYRITGITSMPMRQLTFPIDEQKTMKSVVQYFRERYNFSLKYVSWPCLQAGNDSRPIYLPMEVCKIVEGQRFSRKLNVGQVTEMLKATRQLPHAREESILKMVHHNNYNNDEYTKEFGIRMKNELTSVEARVLPAPKLKYHDSGRERTCSPSVGQWNMINKKMVNGGTVEYWTCLSFSLRLREDEVYKFCSELIGMCNKIGMVINPRPFVDIQFANPHHLESTLREMSVHSMEALKAMGVCGKNLQLLIVVLPEKSGVYGRIKRICETELGIVSQCCMPKHVFKCDRKYLENVALKINVKAGGRNTVLEDALYRKIPLVTDQPTIIFGADVTHPPPGEDSSSSIAAVVASIDWPEVTKYRGLFSAQQHRQEMIQDLFTVIQDPQRGRVVGGMIRELLVAFYRATNRKPHRIIFYRDGVSEGQFSQVLLYEMDAIGKACASLQDGYLPTVTFVVVQKRHHTRLFPEVHGNRDSTDKSGNILPGTVVDKKICHPTKFDFYLCSHAGIQGTSRPTHYHVLLDENKFSADGLQMLTNNLCYTYARCTRSVSIVPPVYYAHLAAYRARYYMEDELSEGGSTSDRTRDRPVEVCRLPQVKDAVKEVMFYC